MDELELWIEFKERYNLEARDALIEKYLNYSFSVGLRIYRRYSDFLNLDKEEIFGIASFCLIKAIENYDHTKNIPFVSFLSKIVSLYIKEEFSKYMNVSLRNQLKILRKISDGKKEDVLKMMISLSYRNMISINQEKEKSRSIHEKISDSEKFEDNFENNEILLLISQSIENVLNDNERNVMKKTYFENKKLAVISQEMNLSKQRVNQLHRSALDKIKRFIRKKIL